MADIYIIYASENHDKAEKIYQLLSEQWDVWWDDKIVGDFARVIEAEISKAVCIVPLYSKHSRTKATVTDELRLGKKYNKEFLPIRLDDCDPPYSFGSDSIIDMRGWSDEVEHPGFKRLKRNLATIVAPKQKPKRPHFIVNNRIPLPALFQSVSSHETQLSPSEAVSALRLFRVPTILISAYDLIEHKGHDPQLLIDELKVYKDNGGFLLVDSGNYEAFRLGDENWDVKKFEKALSLIEYDWAFCFDEMELNSVPEVAVEQILASLERDQSCTPFPVLPIVHAPKTEQGKRDLKNIPWIVRKVSEDHSHPLIAIPERELGSGIITRARTVRAIREELSKLPFYQPVHILGTCNPWSIPILTAAGADTFDGLEWCRMSIDRESHRLHHFQYFDFFTNQKGKAESPIARAFLEDEDVDFTVKVIFHNLDYYSVLANGLREYVNEDNMEAFVTGIMGGPAAKQLKAQITGLFE